MKISKQARRSLFLYTLVVAIGLKDSYLVDACSLSELDAKAFVQDSIRKINDNGGIIAKNALGIVTVGLDVFIVNMQLWHRKLLGWAQNMIGGVVFVDLTKEFCSLASDELHDQIRSELQQFAAQVMNSLSCDFASSTSIYSLRIESEDRIFKFLGGPCLAGLLLGYPLVYYLPGLTEEAFRHGSSLLSHTSLVKFISQGTMRFVGKASSNVVWELAKENSADNAVVLSLHEFTVPASLAPQGEGAEWCQQQLCLEERKNQALALLPGYSWTFDVACVSFVSEAVSL